MAKDLLAILRGKLIQNLKTLSRGTTVTGESSGVTAASGSFAADNFPVVPGSFSMQIGGAAQDLADNGDGTLSAASDGGAGTIDYTTGAVTFTAGGAVTGTHTCGYRYGEYNEFDVKFNGGQNRANTVVATIGDADSAQLIEVTISLQDVTNQPR